MYRFILNILFIITVSHIALAQSGTKSGNGRQAPLVFGKVITEANEPIPYCNVALYTLPDSTLANGTSTNENGGYKLKVRPGNYFIKFSFLSYAPSFQPLEVKAGAPEVKLEPIVLQSQVNQLEEFSVRADKSTMELKLDKRVFNVGKDLANQGGDAADILDNVPSVTVDVEGNVALRGSENIRLLIDGRESVLTGNGTADALKQIPSSMIDKIEVITNPSARYDAEGEVGIINIVLKKEKQKGFNGNVSATLGYPTNYGMSANLNWRKKKLNYFLNSGVRYNENPGGGFTNQEFTFPDTSYSFDRNRKHIRGGLNSNFKGGIDFLLSPKTTLTTSVLVAIQRGDNLSTTNYIDYVGLTDEIIQEVERIDAESEDGNSIEYEARFEHQFKSKEHKLIARVSYMLDDEIEYSTITEGLLGQTPSINQQVNTTEYNKNLQGQLDYVKPIWKEGKLEFGVKSTNRYLENDFLVEELVNGEWQTHPVLNNFFKYTENIQAGYFMIGNKLENYSFQLGIRGEYSDINTELVETAVINPRKYFNWFPSAHFTYDLKKFNSLQLSYSRRISRPGFWSLLPFFNFSDSRFLFSGNPNLNPEYIDAYELGYLLQKPKGSIFSSVYYRRTDDAIQRFQVVDSTGFSRFMPQNTGIENAYGIEFTFSKRFENKSMINGNVNFFNSVTRGSFNGEELVARFNGITSRLSYKVDLPKDLSAQISANYRAPRQTLQGNQRAIGAIDLAFSKDLFNNKGTLSLTIRDLLNTRKRRGETFDDFFYSYTEFQWRSRVGFLKFSYRINQRKRMERGGGMRQGGFDGPDM